MRSLVVLLSLVLLPNITVGFDWPPRVGSAFPELELVNQDGKKLKVSSLKGEVVLVEVIGMTCPACNAWSGAKGHRGFEGVIPQGDLDSIDKYLRDFSGVSLDDQKFKFVQLLLYNMQMKAPTASDASRWAKHFGYEAAKGQYVLAGGEELVNSSSYQMIPGFYLIDRKFTVRYDATGLNRKGNLYTELLPLLGKLVREK